MNVTDLTCAFIRFDTTNPPGNEEGLARYIGTILSNYGYKISYAEHAPGRLSLLASLGAAGESPSVIFTGHLDVVPAGQKPWHSHPFEPRITNGRLYGRGASDMKGGLAAMILAAIRYSQYNPAGKPLMLIFTADEELGCRGASGLAASKLLPTATNLLVVGEPTGNIPYIGHKGGLYLNAVATGKTAHSSMPELGDNAIYKAAQAITRIAGLKLAVQADPLLGYPTMNVGRIEGGQNLNSVPDYARFTIDVRTTGNFDNTQAANTLNRLIGDQISLEELVNLQPVISPVNHPGLKQAIDLCRKITGYRYKPGAAPYLTDAAALAPATGRPPTLILGPGEPGQAHQTDEYCSIDKLEQAVEIYLQIISTI